MKQGLSKRQSAVYVLYASLLGAFVGAFVWLFLRVVSLSIHFVWDYVPKQLNIPCYTIFVCLIGSVIIGCARLAFGKYPEVMGEVFARIKREGKYPYNNILIAVLCAFLPLVFGGSIGPEAGLTGIAAGLCYWVGDRLKLAGKKLKGFSSLGLCAALGVLFSAPLFGIAADLETDSNGDKEFVLPKPFEIFSRVVAVMGGLFAFFILGEFFGKGLEFSTLSTEPISNYDRIMGLPLIAVGILAGMLYALFDKVSEMFFSHFEKNKILTFLSVVFGGLIVGIMGTFMPLTMFSGEEQIGELIKTYTQYAPWLLVVIGVAKMFLTSVCLGSGWRGGHFFPLIFSGVAIGYGLSQILGTSPTMAVATLTAALLAVNMRKPIAVSLLLLLCFPVRVIPWMILATFLAAHCPLPNFLRQKTDIDTSNDK